MAGSGFAPCRPFRVGTKNVPTLPSWPEPILNFIRGTVLGVFTERRPVATAPPLGSVRCRSAHYCE
jgi:hypothetical protein